ncbi:hypothetical protein LXL04_035556 [Taraxacum kok-saghyz]
MDAITYLDTIRYAIRNVVRPFVPTVAMRVYFGINVLINSCVLETSVVQNAPTVHIGGQPNELYTLVMVDPDAPNPNEPHFRQLVSWIVTNIPGWGSCEQGTEIASYERPNPEIGIHRYILILYKQQSRLTDMDTVNSRVCFNVDDFANKHNLGNPVGLAYFNVPRQANGIQAS